MSMLPDDLLNGNVTEDGTAFFTGLSTMQTLFGDLSTNLISINTTLTAFGSAGAVMSPILTDTALLTAIQGIDLNAGAGVTLWTYAPPISQASTFPTIMGTFSSSGMIYEYYTLVQGFIASYASTATQIDSFLTGSNDIQTGITAMNSYLASLNSNFDWLINIDSSFDTTRFQSTGTLVISLIYGCLIGLSALAILGALLMACCDYYKCRYLMYLACGPLFLVTVVGFLAATIISAIIPGTIWGCDYLKTSISTSADFDCTSLLTQTTSGSSTQLLLPTSRFACLSETETSLLRFQQTLGILASVPSTTCRAPSLPSSTTTQSEPPTPSPMPEPKPSSSSAATLSVCNRTSSTTPILTPFLTRPLRLAMEQLSCRTAISPAKIRTPPMSPARSQMGLTATS